MVANVWAPLCRIPWLLCLLPLAPARVTAGRYELHLTTNGPATTGVEATISASLVAKDNGSLTLPSDAHLFRFHWIHSPLMLTAKMEKDLTSTIHVVGNVPGNFLVSVWVTAADCQMCQPVAKSSAVLSVTEFLVGNLVITQNASLPSPSSYLSKTVLKASFLLHDPSNFFKTAYFLYRWDFGDGTLLVTDRSEVYYNYSTVGTSTVKVKVVADWEQEQPGITKCGAQKTGDFSASLKLQEPLRGIQVLGPSRIQAFQKLTVTLNFLGSPPLTVCWRLKSECLPLEERECHPTPVTTPAYNLTYVFHDPGEYCLSIQAQNTVSKTHQYHRVQVWPFRVQPVVLAFPCATLITVMLAVSMYLSLRTAAQHKDLVEVADFDFSPMSAKNPEPSSGVRCCCQLCCDPFVMETPSEYLEVDRENHGLLPPLYKSAKTYTV